MAAATWRSVFGRKRPSSTSNRKSTTEPIKLEDVVNDSPSAQSGSPPTSHKSQNTPQTTTKRQDSYDEFPLEPDIEEIIADTPQIRDRIRRLEFVPKIEKIPTFIDF